MSESVIVVWDDGAAEREMSLNKVDLGELVWRLDGATRTLVTVFAGDGHAAVGGDAQSGLVMYATFDGERFHQLLREGITDGGDVVQVVAGGQAGLYPARCIVSADMALAALLWFTEKSELLPAAEWESS